jgi:anti-sigma regulatory factor (Ser/Thr protein kinase)
VPSASWRASARAESVAFLRQTVADFVAAAGIAEPDVTDIQIAVSEAVTNAVMHAFRDGTEPGIVDVSVTVDDGQVEIVVRDDGRGMAPRDDSPSPLQRARDERAHDVALEDDEEQDRRRDRQHASGGQDAGRVRGVVALEVQDPH